MAVFGKAIFDAFKAFAKDPVTDGVRTSLSRAVKDQAAQGKSLPHLSNGHRSGGRQLSGSYHPGGRQSSGSYRSGGRDDAPKDPRPTPLFLKLEVNSGVPKRPSQGATMPLKKRHVSAPSFIPLKSSTEPDDGMVTPPRSSLKRSDKPSTQPKKDVKIEIKKRAERKVFSPREYERKKLLDSMNDEKREYAEIKRMCERLTSPKGFPWIKPDERCRIASLIAITVPPNRLCQVLRERRQHFLGRSLKVKGPTTIFADCIQVVDFGGDTAIVLQFVAGDPKNVPTRWIHLRDYPPRPLDECDTSEKRYDATLGKKIGGKIQIYRKLRADRDADQTNAAFSKIIDDFYALIISKLRNQRVM